MIYYIAYKPGLDIYGFAMHAMHGSLKPVAYN